VFPLASEGLGQLRGIFDYRHEPFALEAQGEWDLVIIDRFAEPV
jgi:hypothetical protein